MSVNYVGVALARAEARFARAFCALDEPAGGAWNGAAVAQQHTGR